MSPRAKCHYFACDRFYANDNFVSGKTGQIISLKLFYMDFAFSRFVNDSLDGVDLLVRLKIISLLGQWFCLWRARLVTITVAIMPSCASDLHCH